MLDYRITIKSLDRELRAAHVEITANVKHVNVQACVDWSLTVLPLEGTYLVTVVNDGAVHKDTVRKR